MIGGTIIKLTKSAAEHFVKHKQYIPLPTSLPSDLERQRAVFISIYENPGKYFRSQYGVPIPRQPSLAHEIIYNTVEAIRLSSKRVVRPIDLSYLAYSVTVVESLERISRPEHLDPHRYGLYMRSDRNKTAVILPMRVGIETPDDQIATAFRESRINTNAEAVTMYRFGVRYYET